jgi:hypothetical protein
MANFKKLIILLSMIVKVMKEQQEMAFFGAKEN